MPQEILPDHIEGGLGEIHPKKFISLVWMRSWYMSLSTGRFSGSKTRSSSLSCTTSVRPDDAFRRPTPGKSGVGGVTGDALDDPEQDEEDGQLHEERQTPPKG